jgi:Tfp pilus assembly PilM family ATPase/Tfp pilus assembly protein PilN
MPRYLALEWNDDEARVAVAASRAGRVAFEHAFAVDLRGGEAGAEATEEAVGQRIAAALAARHLGRIGALVAVGRSDVELRPLSLPPAPDDELPELVRFQAMREFNALGEDWPLDFIPLDEDPQQPRNVLAAAINPELVGKISATCHGAGLKPARMVLRPCAAASLVCRRRPARPGQVRLLVDLLVDEADLTVVVGDRAAFLRRARLRADPLTEPTAAEVLLSEIRRTMVAAQNQLGVREMESAVLCGAGPQHEALAQSIGQQLPVPLELVDPFGDLRREGDLKRGLPDHPDRFAPLLGMLWDELEGAPPALDFLNPRRPPAPPSRRNTFALAGLAVAMLVFFVILFGLLQQYWLETEIQDLESQQAALKTQLEGAAKIERAVEEIDNWAAAGVGLLDELRWLSDKLPDAQDAMITQLTWTIGADTGHMNLNGRARSVEALTDLERRLQDDSQRYAHRLVGKSKSEDASRRPYPVEFQSSLLLIPKEENGKQQPGTEEEP